jgi:penicillin V acylase-like amidase (Ntn superfamily)
MARRGQAMLGRNFDWMVGHGRVIVNQRGLRKKALVGAPNRPAEWTAKYGSVTFDQVGRELPYGGINERGLDVEQLWLADAEFPKPDDRPAVNELQWIQYQLDNFATVKEVVKNLPKLNIVRRMATVHFIACDAGGDCAVIEPLGGKLVVRRGGDLPLKALTNDEYSASVKYAQGFLPAKDAASLPPGTGSLARFARLAYSLSRREAPSIDGAFARLASVASATDDENDHPTRWAAVADLRRKTVHFKTPDSPADKWLDLARLDFSCGKPVKAVPVDVKTAGDLTGALADFTPADNAELAGKSLATGFAHLPPKVVQKVAAYPDAETCAAASAR